MDPKMTQNWPKMLLFLFLGIIFFVFAKTFFKTVQTFTMGHCLKFLVKEKIFFAGRGTHGVPKQPKLGQNCIFVKIYTNFLKHFP